MRTKEQNNENANDAKRVLASGAVKLSKAQKEVITRLQANEIIHYLNGYDAKCFYSNGVKTISWATILKLENYGLVERKNKRIELTERGRSYCC